MVYSTLQNKHQKDAKQIEPLAFKLTALKSSFRNVSQQEQEQHY